MGGEPGSRTLTSKGAVRLAYKIDSYRWCCITSSVRMALKRGFIGKVAIRRALFVVLYYGQVTASLQYLIHNVYYIREALHGAKDNASIIYNLQIHKKERYDARLTPKRHAFDQHTRYATLPTTISDYQSLRHRSLADSPSPITAAATSPSTPPPTSHTTHPQAASYVPSPSPAPPAPVHAYSH